jgi:hypothetical protein
MRSLASVASRTSRGSVSLVRPVDWPRKATICAGAKAAYESYSIRLNGDLERNGAPLGVSKDRAKTSFPVTYSMKQYNSWRNCSVWQPKICDSWFSRGRQSGWAL